MACPSEACLVDDGFDAGDFRSGEDLVVSDVMSPSDLLNASEASLVEAF